MAKYQPLADHLARHPDDQWRVSFAELEDVLGSSLPRSARAYSAWWANESNPDRQSHKRAWLDGGWRTEGVDLTTQHVGFRRDHPTSTVQDSPDVMAEAVKAYDRRRRARKIGWTTLAAVTLIGAAIPVALAVAFRRPVHA